MTRDEFTTEFIRSMRYVIQKHDRVNQSLDNLKSMGSNHVLETAYTNAQANLDGALIQLADHLYDALEHVHHTEEHHAA